MPCGMEDIGIGEDLPGPRELMPQLRTIAGKIMKSSNDEEAGQAVVGRCPTHRSSWRVMRPLRSRIGHAIHCCAGSASKRNCSVLVCALSVATDRNGSDFSLRGGSPTEVVWLG